REPALSSGMDDDRDLALRRLDVDRRRRLRRPAERALEARPELALSRLALLGDAREAIRGKAPVLRRVGVDLLSRRAISAHGFFPTRALLGREPLDREPALHAREHARTRSPRDARRITGPPDGDEQIDRRPRARRSIRDEAPASFAERHEEHRAIG